MLYQFLKLINMVVEAEGRVEGMQDQPTSEE